MILLLVQNPPLKSKARRTNSLKINKHCKNKLKKLKLLLKRSTRRRKREEVTRRKIIERIREIEEKRRAREKDSIKNRRKAEINE